MSKKIIAVFKTHFDIGFTHLYPDIIDLYGKGMLEDVIKVCESTQKYGKAQEYKWTMSAFPLLKSLENASPVLKEKAEKLIERGQLLCHALPYTSHTEHLGMEELARNFSYAKEFCDRYNRPYPISAKMTDVPGHTIALPTVLADAGIKFLHLGCNPASMPPNVPRFFWWEGLDGKRVLTYYSKGCYGTDLLPPEDWNLPVHLALLQTNDNLGPQGEDVIASSIATIAEYDPKTEFTVGTMDDFYNEIIKCDLSALPVLKLDLADNWIHGVGSYPNETSLLRRSRARLLALEKLYTLYSDSSYKKQIESIFADFQLFGEHTWGLNTIVFLGYDRVYKKRDFIKSLNKPNHQLMIKSWQEQTDRVLSGANKIKSLNSALCSSLKEKYIFNPLNSQNDSPFLLDGEFCKVEDLGALNLKKISDVKIAKEKPALKKETATDITIFNDNLSLTVDKSSGFVTSFYDKTLNKNWAKNIGEYQYDVCNLQDITDYLSTATYRYYDWLVTALGRQSYPDNFKHYQSIAPLKTIKAKRSITVEFCPLEFGVNEYGDCEKVTVEYTLLSDRLNVKLNIINKQETPYVEGMNFNFALNITNPKYKINKLCSIIDPEKDIAEHANNALYCLEDYVSAIDGDNALSIVSHDCALFSIGEHALYKHSRFYQKREDCKILFNLCNNTWGTNFPQWLGGNYSFEFDLISHKTSFDITKKVAEIVNPPLILENCDLCGTNLDNGVATINNEFASKITFGSCDLQEKSPEIQVTGAQLVAIKEAEGGKIIRLRNLSDKKTECKISFDSKAANKQMMICDLFERELEICPSVITLKPFEILSVKIK